MLNEQDIKLMQQQFDRKKYFTDPELCEMMGVSAWTTARWRRLKQIGYIRTPSNTIRYTRRHVEEFEARFEQRAKAS